MSRLETISKPFRDTLLSKDIFTDKKPYEQSHSRAVSNGDEHGKGDNGGSVGSKTDMIQKAKLVTKNKYNSNKPYDSSNA